MNDFDMQIRMTVVDVAGYVRCRMRVEKPT